MGQTEYEMLDSELAQSVDRALEMCRSGELTEARTEFTYILQRRFDSGIAEFGIKATRYWLERQKVCRSKSEGYDRGVFLLEQWSKFETFGKAQRGYDDKVAAALRYFIFSQALEQFNKDAAASTKMTPKMLYMIALAYKKIGDYQNALTAFEQLLLFDGSNSDVLAQLADIYILTNHITAGKVLFREALSDDPALIRPENIESDLFLNLIRVVKKSEPNVDARTMVYWLPVYGRIYDILNVSREITKGDFMKLKKQTVALENEFARTTDYDSILTARLVNKYLLLYDYYGAQPDGRAKQAETENNIKKIAYNIYILFKKNDQEIR